MNGEPMEVCVALGLLLAESAPVESPWRGKIMTFESRPQLMDLGEGGKTGMPDYETAFNTAAMSDGEKLKRLGNLRERVRKVMSYPWGGSTDIEAAFKKMLD